MIKQKNKGFTLVELLAVIVVLAIILVIAVPKVMTIIEDAKKGTLESTAKMIASGAEKQKIQNTVLGKEEEITCDSVAKINNADYASCSIEFVNGTAFVTIEGSGKFEGLFVCDGTKTTAEASNEECEVENLTAVKKIISLYEQEETLNNGLEQTYVEDDETTYDAGIRYNYKSNNRVYFNCDEKDSNNINYGEKDYNYKESCEVWRIVGVFDTEDENGDSNKRVKIFNNSSSFKASWDSSKGTYISEYECTGINCGWGINQWGASEDYEGADLMRLLNGYYIGAENSACTYCNDKNQEICEQICTSNGLKAENMKILTSSALNMIDKVKWYTGASSNYFSFKSSFLDERGNRGSCESECATQCTDTVNRTVEWIGKVGLLYFSDSKYYFKNNENYRPYSFYTMTAGTAGIGCSDMSGSILLADGNYSQPFTSSYINPSVYLKPETYIVCGDGTVELPYVLSLNSKVNPSVCPVYIPPEPDDTASSTSTATSEESTSTATS